MSKLFAVGWTIISDERFLKCDKQNFIGRLFYDAARDPLSKLFVVGWTVISDF